MRKLVLGFFAMICLNTPAMSEMFKIENPASNIYNPASRMDNPNPISSPTQPVPPLPTEHVKEQPSTLPPQSHGGHIVSHKSYNFKSVSTYINEANKAYKQGKYLKLFYIADDALRRISSGTLKYSKKTKDKLEKFKVIGYRQSENK